LKLCQCSHGLVLREISRSTLKRPVSQCCHSINIFDCATTTCTLFFFFFQIHMPFCHLLLTPYWAPHFPRNACILGELKYFGQKRKSTKLELSPLLLRQVVNGKLGGKNQSIRILVKNYVRLPVYVHACVHVHGLRSISLLTPLHHLLRNPFRRWGTVECGALEGWPAGQAGLSQVVGEIS
jgi:hypothetical protein